ncbi:MAG: DUF433 domain-containing protein [Chloroflexota bacterium]|nr:DUF433 domain-containing protein [Chloroflexota bacterium]
MAAETGLKTFERKEAVIREEFDGVKFHKLAPGITTHPLIRSGKPCIKGAGLKVTDIVALKNFQDMKPADIAKYFEIDLAQVMDALNYYASHRDYIDTDIQLDSLNHDQLAEAQYGSSGNPLLSRRESAS